MDDDPGWGFSWWSLLGALVPQLAIRRATRASPNRLLALRQLFVSFAIGLAAVTVVVVILGDLTDGDERPTLSAAIVGGYGLMSLAAPGIIKKHFDTASSHELATSYQNRFFLRIAFAEAAALVGFVIGISVGPWWMYFAGLAFAVVGFIRLAPTAANLRRDQAALGEAGCRLRLIDALQGLAQDATSAQV